MSNLILYSAWYCPFAQRTWAALEHLEEHYTYVETDPYDKTDFWLSESRGLGQVPVLKVQNPNKSSLNIPDSLRTLEYLEDTSGSGRLFSKDPAKRAEQRYWVDFQGREIIPYFYQFLTAEKDREIANAARDRLVGGISEFGAAMSDDGWYFNGDQPDVVDISFAPFALRIDLLLSHYKSFRLPTGGHHWSRYADWWAAMGANAAFRRTMEVEGYASKLVEFYATYARGGGQKDVLSLP